jgi:hypothetical protein
MGQTNWQGGGQVPHPAPPSLPPRQSDASIGRHRIDRALMPRSSASLAQCRIAPTRRVDAIFQASMGSCLQRLEPNMNGIQFDSVDAYQLARYAARVLAVVTILL